MYSLRKLVWLAFLLAAVFLGIIILFGVRQYVLSGQYSALISENENALFHFSTIRESLTEAIIEDDFARVERLIPEMEKLNASFAALEENPLIPNEFKLSLAEKVDLAGTVIRTRRMVHRENTVEERRALYGDMRTIADHLLKYDRIIVGQARSKMLNLQMVIIGSMGIMISCASFFLIMLYRNSVVPLLSISSQLRDRDIRAEDLTCGVEASREIIELTDEIRQLVRDKETADEQGQRRGWENEYSMVAEKVNETTNQLNGIINYAQILADTDDRELTENDREMLQKIIASGTGIAKSWHTLLREGQNDG